MRVREDLFVELLKLFTACGGPNANSGRGDTYSSELAMEGWELWFLRLDSAWILKQPVAQSSCTCSGNIRPLP